MTTAQPRFRDGGEFLWMFGDDILVRCPACGCRAHVLPDPRARWRSARLACSFCGLARSTSIQDPHPRRCQYCHRWIPRPDWTVVEKEPRAERLEARCRRCGGIARSVLSWTVVGVPEDPFFGAALELQIPCCGEVLWAWNQRHLEVLEALVCAYLRERTPGVSGNGTLLSRLPRWMKSAKNRDTVLSSLAALTRMLRERPG